VRRDGVEVPAIDPPAKAFYEQFEYSPLLDQEQMQFLPMATIRKGVRS
jgi:hypothetical protein